MRVYTSRNHIGLQPGPPSGVLLSPRLPRPLPGVARYDLSMVRTCFTIELMSIAVDFWQQREGRLLEARTEFKFMR